MIMTDFSVCKSFCLLPVRTRILVSASRMMFPTCRLSVNSLSSLSFGRQCFQLLKLRIQYWRRRKRWICRGSVLWRRSDRAELRKTRGLLGYGEMISLHCTILCRRQCSTAAAVALILRFFSSFTATFLRFCCLRQIRKMVNNQIKK